MRAILTALLLTVATQVGAACGNLCDSDWWETATEADVQAELDAGGIIGDECIHNTQTNEQETKLSQTFGPIRSIAFEKSKSKKK